MHPALIPAVLAGLLALTGLSFLAFEACTAPLQNLGDDDDDEDDDEWTWEDPDTGAEAFSFRAWNPDDVRTMLFVEVNGSGDCAGFTAWVEEADRSLAADLDGDCAAVFWGLPPGEEVMVGISDGDGNTLADRPHAVGYPPAWVPEVRSEAADWGWTFTTRDGQPVLLDPDGVPQWWLLLPEELDGVRDPVARRVLPRPDGSGVLVLVEEAGATGGDTGSPDTGARDTGARDTGALDTGARDTGAPATGVPEDRRGVIAAFDWEGEVEHVREARGLHDDFHAEGGQVLAIGWWTEVEDGVAVLGDRLVGDNDFDGWTTHQAFPAGLAGVPACRGLAWSSHWAHLAVSCPGVGAVALVDASGRGASAYVGGVDWPVEDDRVLDVVDGAAPVRPGAVVWRDERLVVLDQGEGDAGARVVELEVDLDAGEARVLSEVALDAPLASGGGVAIGTDGATRVAWGDAGTVEQYDADGVRTGRVELGAPVGHLYVVDAPPFD